MRSAQHLAVLATLLFGATLLGGGCYRPNIKPGGYRCGGDAGACPDGFVCDPRNNTCVQTLPDGSATGGTTGTGGKGGTGGATGTGGTTGTGGAPCLSPVPDTNCPTDAGVTGMCDPVCNTGCGACSDKCSVNTNGALTCNPVYVPPNPTPTGLLTFCSQYAPTDQTKQSDNCGAGQICINASACPNPRCYQFCRGNSDCQDGASCSRDGGAFEFCDVPPTTCNPLASARSNSGCAQGFSCYLSPTGANTLCDCQFDRTQFGQTSGGPGDPCNHSRDCVSGNVCVNATGFSGECEPICVLPVDGGTDSCKTGGCQPLPNGSGSMYGYCHT